MKIGFFDSGIGGTTVLKCAMQKLPDYAYLYYADNAHLPYGSKSPEELYTLTTTSLVEMFNHGCELVIIACNTATTVLPRIQQEWLPRRFPDRRVLGIIRPTVEHMIASGAKTIYLLATEATVKAASYQHELHKLGSDIHLIQIPCPELATAIEEASDVHTSTYIHHLLHTYLRDIPSDAVLYTGCTHYEIVQDEIYAVSGIKAFTQGHIGSESLSVYIKKYFSLKTNGNFLGESPLPQVCLTSKSKSYSIKILRNI